MVPSTDTIWPIASSVSLIVSSAATVTGPSLRRISNAWPIDGSAIATASSDCRYADERALARGREREPGDEREHERRADEVQRSSPHSSFPRRR